MNIKDLFGPLLLSLSFMFLFKSFWGWYQKPQLDTGFVAPLSKTEQQPLLLEVDFDDAQKKVAESFQTVTTDHAVYTFSNHGAALINLDFVRNLSGNTQEFQTITRDFIKQREERSFLLAFDQKTPYYYTFDKKQETDKSIMLFYSAITDQLKVKKVFTLYKNKHQLSLHFEVTPLVGSVARPRIIFGSPNLKSLQGEETINALLIDKAESFKKITEKKLNQRAGFFEPILFGSEGKYFIHTMVNDADKFTQRAYYKKSSDQLFSFLEGPTADKTKKWDLDFYCGPKELSALNAVSIKLDKALDYGFFSVVAKLMLYLLNFANGFVHNYGFAILLITLLLKLLLLPFTFKGNQKMKKMQDFSQKMNYLKQRYKNDPEGLKLAQQQFIKEHGMPGMGGCLPLLLQLPIFVGLSSALNNSIELYRAPFIGWIHDLSMPDPYYLLPLLITISIFSGSIVGQSGKKDFKQVFTAFALALFFGAFTSTMASGLALFIFANAFLHVVQTKTQEVLGL